MSRLVPITMSRSLHLSHRRNSKGYIDAYDEWVFDPQESADSVMVLLVVVPTYTAVSDVQDCYALTDPQIMMDAET